MAKIDVVVPCYNYGRFLTSCVGSVLEQSVRDLRVLIIDDGSTDDSLAVARKLAQGDGRVSFFAHSQNKGHISTYNEGIAWASADYFLLLSADDLLVAGALERATEVMDRNPDIVLTYGDCIVWHDDHPFPAFEDEQNYTWTRHDLIKEICATAVNCVPTPTAIGRTRVQKEVGGYRASLPHSGDMEMWLRFAAHGSVARINAVQAIYRKHSTAMSNAYFAERLPDYLQLQRAFDSFFDEYDHRLKDVGELRSVARGVLAKRVFRSGIGLLRRGRVDDALRLIRAAIDMDHRLSYLRAIWKSPNIHGPSVREGVPSINMDSTIERVGGLSKILDGTDRHNREH